MTKRRKKAAGYSLIEVLAVLLIIGLVMTFALPGWHAVMTKARRSDATDTLLRLVARQEQFRLEHRRYALADELALAPPAGLGLESQTPRNFYRLALSSATAGYAATATVLSTGSQKRDLDCWVFGIEQNGRRWSRSRADTDTTNKCWGG
jgi:prepilin-type N-terminal cleavage/methylation domain-containing protein